MASAISEEAMSWERVGSDSISRGSESVGASTSSMSPSWSVEAGDSNGDTAPLHGAHSSVVTFQLISPISGTSSEPPRTEVTCMSLSRAKGEPCRQDLNKGINVKRCSEIFLPFLL